MSETAYKHIKTMELPGAVVRVYSPILTEEERERRMKQIHDAAAALLKSAMVAQKEKEKTNNEVLH